MFPRVPVRGLLFLFASLLSVWLYRRVWYRTSLTFRHDASSGKNANVRKSLFLQEEQCRVEFPELMKEIENAIAEGPFQLRRLRDDSHGLVQGRIKDGKVCCFLHEVVRSR